MLLFKLKPTRFLVTAPTVAITVPLAQILSSQIRAQNSALTSFLAYNISEQTT
jgi:hypothetical protein